MMYFNEKRSVIKVINRLVHIKIINLTGMRSK